MSKELINKLKSPYSVDRYILEEFIKQGFNFDRNRSQYIQYCYELFWCKIRKFINLTFKQK